MGNLEIGSVEIEGDKIDLPKEFDGVSNRDKFLSAYKDIKDWYGEENVIQYSKIIITKRENSQEDLKRGYFGSVKNRLDFLLFDTIYPEFADIDKTLRTTSDTGIQRGFRQILVNLEKKLRPEITPTDREFIKKEIKRIFPTIKTKEKGRFNIIFNSIYNEIKDHYRVSPDNLSNLTVKPAQNIDSVPFLKKKIPLSNNEIENMNKIEISKDFSNMKNYIFSLMGNDEDIKSFIKISGKEEKYWNSYCSGIFNSFAEQINVLFGDGKWIPETFYKDKNIVDIILAYFKEIIIGGEVTEKKLVHTVKQILLQDDDIFSKFIDNNDEQIKKLGGKIDFAAIKAIELTTQEEKELNDANINNIPKEKLRDQYKIYKYLKQKEIKNELDNESKSVLEALEAIFGQDGQIKKRVRLYEIKNREFNLPNFGLLHGKDGVEYATGNIKDVSPVAIVKNHDSIKKFVEGGNQNSSELSNNRRKSLLSELKGQHSNDSKFQESIKYLDDIGNINRVKIRNDGITDTTSINNIERNRKTVNEMIERLAKKRDRNEICCRKSIMTSCFRAISSFFDTVNNNGENFASEFKISNLNDDIEFDEGTGIISMKGTIGANNNHIKLYYNTKTGTLEFDNFLAYNTQDNCYKIGKGNGEREKIKIQLPTMQEMEIEARSVNFNLIERITQDENMYEDMLGLVMRNSIWHRCFKGFIGVDMEVNKSFVKEFNEKNILKQDIINTIYGKFYNQEDISTKLNGCLTISEGNEPEQFKLIKLISDTIDNCGSSNSLLRFRNAINGLDEILTNNHELVKNDVLLQYLFGDNLSNDSDITDASRKIFEQENEDVAISKDANSFATYQSEEKHEDNGNKTINYNIFLDLLSENKFGGRIINIDCFEAAISTIKNSGKQLLDDEQGLLWKNYTIKRDGKIIPDFKKEKELANIESRLDEAYT